MSNPSSSTLTNHQGASGWALAPLGLFILLFLGTGVYLHLNQVDYAFYQLPAPVAIIPAILLAIWLDGRLRQTSELNKPIDSEASISTFIAGMGNNKVITMCLIYLLAGAFSSVAKASGGVEAVVSLGLDVVPPSFVLAGLFLISALIATAMGTSMGTIGAVAPIAVGVIDVTGINAAIVAGAVVGGAMFGDNLSFISDTTIASTKTQGAELKDKFKENLAFALPAALICLLVYGSLGASSAAQIPTMESGSLLLALPYFLIIVLAVLGVNVFLLLILGILLSALFGALFSDYALSGLGKDIYNGFAGMQEIFLLSMLIGGLSELMKQQGGLAFLVNKIEKLTQRNPNASKKSSNQFAIAGLAFTTNTAVANNTVAIIVAGDTAKQLAKDGEISAKRSASLLDIFSCCVQGLLPYGAQALLAAASFGITPVEVVVNVWYCMVLLIVSLIAVYLRRKTA